MLTIEPPPASHIAAAEDLGRVEDARDVDVERPRERWPSSLCPGGDVDAGVVDEHRRRAVLGGDRRERALQRRPVGDVCLRRRRRPPARRARRRSRRHRSAPPTQTGPRLPSAPVTTAMRPSSVSAHRRRARTRAPARTPRAGAPRGARTSAASPRRAGGGACGRARCRARTAAGRRPATSARGRRASSTCPAGRSRAATIFLPIFVIGSASLGCGSLSPVAERERASAGGRAPSSAGRPARARSVVGALHRAVEREVLLDDPGRRARRPRPASRCRCRGRRSRRPPPGTARGRSRSRAGRARPTRPGSRRCTAAARPAG